MAKDPAFLFYSSDFLTGMQDLTMEERGQYITLLCLQHQKGHLTDKAIRIAVGDAAADVMAKFRQDSAGLWYNERLEKEIQKRQESAEKQRQRAIDGWEKRKKDATAHTTADAAAMPLENANENEDKTDKKKKAETEKELNDVEVGKTIEYMKFTAQRKMSPDQVLTYWKAFLIHSEGEFHRNRNDKLQHFRNWLKKQPHETTKRTTDTAAPGSQLSPI